MKSKKEEEKRKGYEEIAEERKEKQKNIDEVHPYKTI